MKNFVERIGGQRVFWGALIVVVIAVAALLQATLSGPEGSDSDDTAQPSTGEEKTSTIDVVGNIRLTDSGIERDGGDCYGTGGYSDMGPGSQVVVRDASGTTLAVGSLDVGKVPTGEAYASVLCDFAFTVPDVPAGEGPYSVAVGSRGEFSFNEADAGNLALTLG